jgi:DNA-binding FadR family transcriptional regulator
LQDDIRAELDSMHTHRATRQVLPSGFYLDTPHRLRRAEVVARDVFRAVVVGRLEPGHLLGSEPDLMAHYGVSRAVFREAVRLLEHHQIALMRRGAGGGLFVAPPTAAAVSDVVALYLARRGTKIAALAELRSRFEVALVGLAIDRLDDQGRSRLIEAAQPNDGEMPEDLAIHNLHATIARLTGNRALELLALVLIRLTRFYQYREITKSESDSIRYQIDRAHLGIADAMQAGDHDLARKRARRHLEALSAQLQ